MPKTADKPTLPARDHKVGCPATWVERYVLPVPDNQGGGTATVIRCVECGGHKVTERHPANPTDQEA